MRMKNRIGLVTAAASGMGRAGAIRFAKEGACVGVVDINAKGVQAVVDEIKAAGGKAIGLVGDLRTEKFSRGIVADVVKAYGGLDFVWCHAGHPGPSRLEDMDVATLDLAIDLNLKTAMFTVAAAVPELKKRKNAAMLFTASTAGIRGSPRAPVYSAMKFGMVGYVRSLAKRLAPDIRANVLCPGGVDTPMLRQFIARPDMEETRGKNVEDLLAASRKNYPFGRAAQPEEIANCALFLLSSEASYVSGATLAVDGCVTA